MFEPFALKEIIKDLKIAKRTINEANQTCIMNIQEIIRDEGALDGLWFYTRNVVGPLDVMNKTIEEVIDTLEARLE